VACLRLPLTPDATKCGRGQPQTRAHAGTFRGPVNRRFNRPVDEYRFENVPNRPASGRGDCQDDTTALRSTCACGGVGCLREVVARRPWMAGGTRTDARLLLFDQSGSLLPVLLSAHCETEPDGVELPVTRAKPVSATPLRERRCCSQGRGGQAIHSRLRTPVASALRRARRNASGCSSGGSSPASSITWSGQP
jgi:hypothetical protein